MNSASHQPSLALTILISSLVTTIAVLGILYSARGPIVSYLIPVGQPVRELSTDLINPLPPQSELSVVAAVAKANPAVVSVVVTKDVPIYERYYEEYNPWGFWGGFQVPRVRENGTESQEVGGGSGFIVSADGLIVTNRHVVDDAEARYSVLLNDGTSHVVTVVARDPQLDIAILRLDDVPEAGVPYLKFADSTSLQLGETVIAIGNALAEFRNSVSVGVVSGLARSITASDGRGKSEQLDQVIQTDAAINPGNSGGPLLNLAGEVVGVNVATSRGADNIGFALPAHVVKQVVDSVSEYGEIVRPFLGVRFTMVNARIQELNNLSVDYGALVIRGDTREELAVMPGSPADKAGLAENDIILRINDVDLRDRDLASVLRDYEVGDTLALTVLSKGKERVVSVVLERAPNQ